MADRKHKSAPRKKPAPQWHKQQRLAGKRNAKDDDGEAPRGPPPIPVNQRLAFRPAEFAALVGVSYVTIWRAMKRGDIETIVQNGVRVIPRSYAVRAGYITDIF
jgi:hypothetical protein